MIALILGGARSVWDDLSAAEALLGDSRRLVIATNSAGFLHKGRIDAWATLHPELLGGWMTKRRGNKDFRAFSPGHGPMAEVVAERWPASSGGYGLQVALYEMGATAAILCGVPLEREAGHLVQEGLWAPPTSYRRAFASALPEIGGRVRSMSGWTRDLFGPPTAEWLASTVFLKPLGASRPQHARIANMFRVENVSTEGQFFNAWLPNGNLIKVRLAPGEAGMYECDPKQAVFQRELLKATEVKPPRAAKTKPAAEPEAPAPQPDPVPEA